MVETSLKPNLQYKSLHTVVNWLKVMITVLGKTNFSRHGWDCIKVIFPLNVEGRIINKTLFLSFLIFLIPVPTTFYKIKSICMDNNGIIQCALIF